MRLVALEEGEAATGPGTTGRDEVEAALRAHLCRCTGWQSIVEAALSALGAPGTPSRERGAEHSSAASDGARRDPVLASWRAQLEGGSGQVSGPEAVLGRAGFADDTAPPGALVQLGTDAAPARRTCAPPAPASAGSRAGTARCRCPIRSRSRPARGRSRCRRRGRSPPMWSRTPAGAPPPECRLRPWPTAAPSAGSVPARRPTKPAAWPSARVGRRASSGGARTSCGRAPSAHRWRSRSRADGSGHVRVGRSAGSADLSAAPVPAPHPRPGPGDRGGADRRADRVGGSARCRLGRGPGRRGCVASACDTLRLVSSHHLGARGRPCRGRGRPRAEAGADGSRWTSGPVPCWTR